MRKLTPQEQNNLHEFLHKKECVYAYALKNGVSIPREKNQAAMDNKETLISRLCYKVNQSKVDEFMRRKELNFAFFCALGEIKKLLLV